METSQVETVKSITQVEYAGFWARYAALFVDGIILIIPTALFAMEFGSVTGKFTGLLVTWTYNIYMLNTKQATIGKIFVGLKVTSSDGKKPTIGRLVLRETFGKFLSLIVLFIGYIMVAFTEKKQGLHDKLADTVVIYDQARQRRKWPTVLGIIIAIIGVIWIAVVLLIDLRKFGII